MTLPFWSLTSCRSFCSGLDLIMKVPLQKAFISCLRLLWTRDEQQQQLFFFKLDVLTDEKSSINILVDKSIRLFSFQVFWKSIYIIVNQLLWRFWSIIYNIQGTIFGNFYPKLRKIKVKINLEGGIRIFFYVWKSFQTTLRKHQVKFFQQSFDHLSYKKEISILGPSRWDQASRPAKYLLYIVPNGNFCVFRLKKTFLQ